MKNQNQYKLSNQACGALMLALQNGMLAAARNKPKEDCDIMLLLKNFELENTSEGLIVMNPPVINFGEDSDDLMEEHKE